MKYYWSLWLNNRGTVLQKVTEDHPFNEVDTVSEEKDGMRVILNYKEITKEEYEVFSKKTIANYTYCEPDFNYYAKMIKHEIL